MATSMGGLVEEFKFVQVSGQGNAASWKKQVRCHASRNSKSRRRRVLEYQSERLREAHQTQTQSKGALSGLEPQGILVPVSPRSYLGAARTDPFNSFSRSVSPFESYLLDHFVHHVVLSAIICLPFMSIVDERVFRHAMATDWIQLAGTDPGLLAGVFMVACRNLTTLHYAEIYHPQALRYKSECIRRLQDTLRYEGTSISDLTLMKTFALASDASTTGDHDASIQHLKAAREMVRLRGGVGSFNGSGLLEKFVIWFLSDPLQGRNTIVEPFCVESSRPVAS
ncbi:hypothetical protein BGZ63DRAFT_393189 [Mariannaea sp. PMI_226]|nr:hypothetical protein BGZ63DRAFT_393189 [Mariannaea sp. PMI_226]